jgi:hypothetical protein
VRIARQGQLPARARLTGATGDRAAPDTPSEHPGVQRPGKNEVER